MDRDEAKRRAAALDRAHDIDEAIRAYAALVTEDPSDNQARAEWTRLLMETSRYVEAEQVCHAGLAVAESAPMLAAISQLHQTYFQVPEAIAAAQRAIEADIGCGHAWYALATAYGLAGDDIAVDDRQGARDSNACVHGWRQAGYRPGHYDAVQDSRLGGDV